MGFSISIEGGDGSGKSTVIEGFKKYLNDKGYNFIVTREPGGVRISEAIREIILTNEYTEMDSRTEALLFAAARRQHYIEKIKPALAEGKLVIIDRFIDSSIVYQGVARGIGKLEVEGINDFALEGFRPDLTVVLDIPTSVALKRISQNPNREVNKLDLEHENFHSKVRNGYLELANENKSGRFVVVDASKSPKNVLNQLIMAVENRLKKWYNLY